jgi:V/A-type H+-transporting ATPase subunit K
LYGIIIAILLMTGVGLLGVLQEGITFKMGLGAIGIGLTMGFAAISAIGQGVVAGGAVGANLRDEKSMGKGLVLSVIPETYAIFGLLISILMLLGLQLI